MRRVGILLLALFAGSILSPGTGQGQAPDPGAAGWADPDCPVCALWLHYEGFLARSRMEAAPIENGVVYFFAAEDFRTIEGLHSFAYARQAHDRRGLDRRHPRIALEGGHRESPGEVRLEISTSAHGFFALATSDNPVTVDVLRREASAAVKRQRPVRF